MLEGINSRDFGNTWICGNDREKEGEWKWIEDGSFLKFEDWGSGEPNNSGNNEDCMWFWGSADSRSGKWNDARCSTPNMFLCTKRIGSGRHWL